MDYFGCGWGDEDPRPPRRDPEPESKATIPQLTLAAKAVAAAIDGQDVDSAALILREVLVHAAASLQALEGHVVTSERFYRVGDHMAVACKAPDWREI